MAEQTDRKFRHPELPPLPEERPKPKTILGRISSMVSGFRSYLKANQYSDGLTPDTADDIIRLYEKELEARKGQHPPEYFLDPDRRTEVLDEVIRNAYYELIQNKDEMTIRRVRIQLLEKAGLVPRAL